MPGFSKTIFIFVICVLMATRSWSQDSPVITKDFTGHYYKELAHFLESETGYTLFYDPEALDSLPIDVAANKRTLRAILSEVFAGTDVYFAVDNLKNVFIVKGYKIQGGLRSDFFSTETRTSRSNQAFALDLFAEQRKEAVGTGERLHAIGNKNTASGSQHAFLSGHIRESSSGEPIAGAAVYVESLSRGVFANEFGQYSIELPTGTYALSVSAIGMEKIARKIIVYGDGKLDFNMVEEVASLKEVVIESDRNMNVSGRQMGFERLDIKNMKQVLTAMGEVDVFRVALTLPGIQTAGEGTTGLNVRGGATDQNLILYNDAVVFNPSHLFGFFTAFNSDVIRRVEVLKSGIPPERGGRLSSVVDITAREGNKKQFAGSGGIGLLTGRISLEGPLRKDKTSFIVGARSTYSSWLLKHVPDDAINRSKASFYDLNINLSHEADAKNNFYVSGYLSGDEFALKDDTLFKYANAVFSLKWKHVFGNRLQGVMTVAHSGYNYSMQTSANPVNAFKFSNGVAETDWKADFNYFPAPDHTLTFGTHFSLYGVAPGKRAPNGMASLTAFSMVQKEKALENAVYVSDDFDISPKLSVHPGIRYSFYNALGPRNVFRYPEGLSKNAENILDTVRFAAGSSLAFYHGPEFRVSVRYLVSDGLSLKASYNSMRQYLQTLSNTTSMSPTDIWKLTDRYIKPQLGSQWALGVYRNFHNGGIETSIEAYYKTMENIIDYKDGAEFLMNPAIEADVIDVNGIGYGLEVMAKKSYGKFNGWLNYTYSRSLLKANAIDGPERINDGRYYPSNYDKPHAANLVANYKLSHRFSLSLNTIYSRGRPITLPIAKYIVGGSETILYSERNQYRVPDYFRIDLSMNIEGNHRIKKLAHSSWTIGVYNLTGRRNIYSVYFRADKAVIQGYKMSVFGAPIPTITYNFRF